MAPLKVMQKVEARVQAMAVSSEGSMVLLRVAQMVSMTAVTLAQVLVVSLATTLALVLVVSLATTLALMMELAWARVKATQLASVLVLAWVLRMASTTVVPLAPT